MHEQATISRRALAALPIAALAGATAAPSASLAAVSKANLDAELLDLGRRWEACRTEMSRLAERLYEAEERTIVPPRPEAVYVRRTDRRFWTDKGQPELVDGVAGGRHFYSAEMARQVVSRLNIRVSPDRSTHDAAILIRAREILEAHEAWAKLREANELAAGVPSAMEALRTATFAGTEIRRRITLTPARTLEGLFVKATLALWSKAEDDETADEVFRATLERDKQICSDALTASLVRDVLAMSEQRRGHSA